jgi:predicted metalloprotease
MSASRAGGAPALGLILRFLPFLLKTKAGRILLLVGAVGYAGMHFMGVDVLNLSGPGQVSSSSAPLSEKDKEMGEFVSVVLANTEDIWTPLFQQMGRTYEKPVLVLFRNSVNSACGYAQAAMGPFYCPGDNKLYIDLSFYEDMKNKLGAPGDFAQAYVIAHEVGHHVQNLMGITGKMDQMRGRVSQREYNQMSVRVELQADCFAGIWAHHNQKSGAILEPGDVEEAMNAAAAIGDDALQRKSQGQIVPDSFTHGSSEQRQRWFHTGLKSGSVQACDTFATRNL